MSRNPVEDTKPATGTPIMAAGHTDEEGEPGPRDMEAYLRIHSGSPPARAGYPECWTMPRFV